MRSLYVGYKKPGGKVAIATVQLRSTIDSTRTRALFDLLMAASPKSGGASKRTRASK